jgi:hypothetical protein
MMIDGFCVVEVDGLRYLPRAGKVWFRIDRSTEAVDSVPHRVTVQSMMTQTVVVLTFFGSRDYEIEVLYTCTYRDLLQTLTLPTQ